MIPLVPLTIAGWPVDRARWTTGTALQKEMRGVHAVRPRDADHCATGTVALRCAVPGLGGGTTTAPSGAVAVPLRCAVSGPNLVGAARPRCRAPMGWRHGVEAPAQRISSTASD